jgi:Trypsin-like peptidase domain
MHARAGRLLFVPLLLLSNFQPVRAACIDPAQLAHSTVSIMRHFDDAERDERPGLIGVRGTGWFLSPTTIVTAEHVTAGMKLSTAEWKPLEIMDGDSSQFIAARIQRLAGAQAERLAVIELEHTVSDARSVTIRKEPLVPEEPVITLAYPAGRLQLVSGRFVRFGDDGKLAGLALLEFYEGDNRLIIDHGASGAPVIDCNGGVAAVVSNVFTQSIQWVSREVRISTAWGTPNVVSVPAQALDDFSKPGLEILQLNSSADYPNSVDGGAALLR